MYLSYKKEYEQYKIKFEGTDIYLFEGVYSESGNRALLAYSLEDFSKKEDGDLLEPFMTISINVDEKMPENMFVIKDYSENEGIYDCLNENGYIERIIGFFSLDLTSAPLVKFKNIKLPSIYQE